MASNEALPAGFYPQFNLFNIATVKKKVFKNNLKTLATFNPNFL